MHSTLVLSHADAQRALAAILVELEHGGWGAAVAVTDAHGELIAFLRTDGCPLASINNAIHKAFTAAREKVESSELAARARREGWPLSNFADPRYIGWGGGVPIIRDGVCVGGIGVSGLSEAQDAELARLGAAAV